VLAKDGAALTTRVSVPDERLEAGPKGHRVHVIDFDASTNAYYQPRDTALDTDHYVDVTDLDRLIRDPYFHQQNVYAIAMATLCEFQRALGRPVSWGFANPSHQLKIAPHAFAQANAYYSRKSESLSFGYFPGTRANKTIFTCLSHDVIAHETTHALLDGLRNFFTYPSSPDQGAFHEGFSDVIALLSVFKSVELIERSLAPVTDRRNLVHSKYLDVETLGNNVLIKLADQLGDELKPVRGEPLRHSIKLKPSPEYLKQDEFQEAHRRGEILVAALMHAFLEVWLRRLGPIGLDRKIPLNRTVVAEEGATAARHLMRIAIRGLDYLPPIDMKFGDYLSALLTADSELNPDDTRYAYREALTLWFGQYGITPASDKNPDGIWDPPRAKDLVYGSSHFEHLQRDADAVFRFIWENGAALAIEPDAFTRVVSVRPCIRVSRDGFILRETVAEYVQTLKVFANELGAFGIEKPAGIGRSAFITLYGGGTLIFNEYGQVKFHIGKGVKSTKQTDRLQSLYERGYFNRDEGDSSDFARLHQRRMTHRITSAGEQW